MNRTVNAFFLLSIINFSHRAACSTDDVTETVVGFAACNKHDREQTYWAVMKDVLTRNGSAPADGFAWLGDVVYADNNVDGKWVVATPAVMRGKFDTFKNSPAYSDFRSVLKRPPTGVWDDHDMGQNDGGAGFVHRAAAQAMYLDFLDVPPRSPRLQRHGVYHLEAIPFSAPPEAAALRQFEFAVCFVLLDGRSARDSPGPDSDMLGEEQWQWLAVMLADPSSELGEPRTPGRVALFARCAVTAVASGVQILGDEKPTENWGDYPRARRRLVEMLHRHNARRFVFLSGDVHYAELQRVSIAGDDHVEITSSGLTHALGDHVDDWTFDFLNANPRRLGRHLGRSFGSITIVDSPAPRAHVRVHSVEGGNIVLEHTIEIGPHDTPAEPRADCGPACTVPVQAAWSKRFFEAVDRYVPFPVAFNTKHRMLEYIAATLRTVRLVS
jgi:alkaline phosphatase D